MNTTEHRSTARALEILQYVARSSERCTLAKIAEALNAPKSSLFPILHTLNQNHFLLFDTATVSYKIGPAAFQVGMAYVNRIDILKHIEREMDSIVEKCSETVHFAILDCGNVVYLLKKDSPEAIRMTSTVGLSLPAYGTGIGKALLIDHDINALRALYPDGLQPLTINTINDFDKLESQLLSFRHDDVSFEYEESNLHIQCVGAALRKNQKIVAALSVAVPTFRCDDEKKNYIRGVLLASKRRLEELFRDANLDFIPNR